MIALECPFCEGYLEAPPEAIGQRIQCGHCEEKFSLEASYLCPLKKQPQEEKITSENLLNQPPKVEEPQVSTEPKPPKKKKKKSSAPIILFAIIIAAVGFYIYKNPSLLEKSDTNEIAESSSSNDSAIAKSESVKSSKTQPNSRSQKTELPNDKRLTEKDYGDDSLWLTDEKEALTPQKEIAKISQTFPVKTIFERISIRDYFKTYPYPNLGWMPNNPPDPKKLTDAERLNPTKNEALEFGHHFGPLGVRVRPYVHDHQNRGFFRMMVPDCLRDAKGKLALQGAEVVSIAPNSPADGYLQEGDIIIGIEGQPILSGNQHRPEWRYISKNRRGIQPQAGELIDIAQGRGDIRLQVLRWPREEKVLFQQNFNGKNSAIIAKKAVKPGDQLLLIIDQNGKNSYDQALWLNPVLTGPAGTLDLSEVRPESASTGWGTIKRGEDFENNKIDAPSITVHAQSTLIFTIPQGYNSFAASVKSLEERSNFNAIVKTIKSRPHLTTSESELWKGRALNTKEGEQEFSVKVQQGLLKLHVNNYDGFNRDGGLWWNLKVSGTYGTKKLTELDWLSATSTNGRIRIYKNGKTTRVYDNEITDVISTGTDSDIVYQLPKGTTTITGNFCAQSGGIVQPQILQVNPILPLKGEHAKHAKNIRFAIGKTESFADSAPKDCSKSAQMAKRQAEFLAAQQNSDGSWDRQGGYTGGYWDTAYCGLALMAMDDPKYDEAIKKAAYYSGYVNQRNKWTVPRANILTFLCEYYFRTKDKQILAAIQNTYYQLKACVKSDFMAGHSVTGFGYGIAGQHIGSGNMAVAMALVAKTPVNTDKEFIDNIIEHMGELAVNGTFPYGRGRRMERSEKRDYTSGNAMLAPAVLAAYLHGGHASFIQDTKERYRASIGEGDNTHSGSTKAFTWTSLAMAAMDEEIYFDHMRHFRYKLTLNDIWEGGMMFNSFPMDLQTPEKAYGLWIRTAGTILALQAHKHNLIISGKKGYLPKSYLEEQPATEWEKFIHQYYARNWAITGQMMTSRGYSSIFKSSLKSLNSKMRKIKADDNMVSETKKLVLASVPGKIKQIMRASWPNSTAKAHAAEMLSGLDFLINVTKEGGQQKVSIETRLPFHNLNWGMSNDEKREFFEKSPLPLKAEIRIKAKELGKELVFNFDDLSRFNFDRGNRTIHQKTNCSANGKAYEGKALISFSLGKSKFKYIRPILINQPFNAARAGDPTNWRRTTLTTRMAPRAIYQSLPVMLMDQPFDAMYPAEAMIFAKMNGKHDTKTAHAFAEGDRVVVDINSSTPICAFIMDLDFAKQSLSGRRFHKPKALTAAFGSMNGELRKLHDFNNDTAIEIQPSSEKPAVLEFDFGKSISANGIDIIRNNSWSGIRIWAEIKGQWIPLFWDGFTHKEGYHPEFALTKARKWRLEFEGHRGQKIQEIRFYESRYKEEVAPPIQKSDSATFAQDLL